MNVNPSLSQLLAEKDLQAFQNFFQEKKITPKETISFIDFANLMKNSPCIKEANVQVILEQIKKELKGGTGNENDAQIMMNETEYYRYIKNMVVAHNKAINEKDEAFRELFDSLCKTGNTLSKTELKAILDSFALDIDYQNFFSSVAGVDKKDSFSFEDFCCLFKGTTQGREIFRETIGHAMTAFLVQNKEEGTEIKNPDYPFPILIVKKN